MTKRFKILVFILIVLLIIFLNTFRKEVKNFFYLISSPTQKTFWQAGDWFSDILVIFFRVGAVEKENQALFEKNLELISENSANRELAKENQSLRQALDLGLEKKFSLVLAEIIGKDVDQDFVLLNKGSQHNVHANNPVITSQNIVCGRIAAVYSDFSKAELISSNDFSFDIAIQANSRHGSDTDIKGLAQGKSHLKLFIDLIPQEAEIREHDLVITTALGGIFPAGMLVGEVKTAIKNDIAPFQEIQASPFCNLNEIQNLFIMQNEKPLIK